MITVEVKGKRYTITKCSIVSEGEAKEYLEECVNLASKAHRSPANGFREPWMYMHLGEFKDIKLISCDFKPPEHKSEVIY